MPHLAHRRVFVTTGELVLAGELIGVLAISSRSSAACLGAGEGADAHGVCDIDPCEPANIIFLGALEFTQAAPHSFCLKE